MQLHYDMPAGHRKDVSLHPFEIKIMSDSLWQLEHNLYQNCYKWFGEMSVINFAALGLHSAKFD